ncbi:MAG: hypothetical protein VB064_12710, partial [Oscillospiraceae bacterium]|nr:hypothetical protein [Oscillospiraceae bacterium]
MDLELNLVYNSQSAKLYDEGTSSAAITKSAGTVVTAYYEVYDSYGNWLRTSAQQYSSSEPSLIDILTQTPTSGTTVPGSTTSGNETWVFNGYYEFSPSTGLLKSDSIINATIAKSATDSAKNIFGVGWRLDLPTLNIDTGSVYVTLADGQTYLYDSTAVTGLKNYQLGDVSFATDTSVSNGTDTSAYKLRYASGFTQYYSSYGDLLLETDRFGNQITYYWTTNNGLRLLTKIVDSAGRIVTLDYNESGAFIRYGDKTITLSKAQIPGIAGKYCLSSYMDANGNTTGYTYTFDRANFDILGKTAAVNTYANLASITYQTGLRTSYLYSASTKNLGSSGSMTYFKAAKRWDSYGNAEYSTQEYYYSGEPDGYPSYKASTIPTSYSYSTKVFNKDGEAVTYFYNYKHLLVKTESTADALTMSKDIWYDENKNVPVKDVTTKTANGLSRISSIDTYEYDSMGNMVLENHPVDPDDLEGGEYITRYSYDSAYNILTGKTYKQDKNTTIIEKYTLSSDKKSIAVAEVYSNDALLKRTCYDYSSNGNMLKSAAMMDSDSWSITSYTYGSDYKELYPTMITCVESDTASGEHSVKLKSSTATYDFYTGKALTSTDGNGNTTSYEYDVLGRVVKELLPDGHSRTTKYDDKKNTVLTTDAEGGSLLYCYDSVGLLASVTKTLTGEVIVSNSYDARGNLISSTDANGNVTAYGYDVLDRLISNILTDREGKIISKKTISYTDNFKDQYGKIYYKVAVTTAGDTKPLIMESYFNGRDQLVKESRVGASTVQYRTYTFDYLSNTLSITGYDGAKTSYTYNAFGKGLTATDRNGNTSCFSYDMLGNQITATNALGVTVTTRYDALGNVTSVSIPQDDGRSAVTKYYYDLAGNMIKTVDANGGVTKQSYNSRGLLTAVEQVISPKKSIIVKLEFDGESRETARITGLYSEADTGFSVQTKKYDAYGYLILEKDAVGNTTTYKYDANGNVISSIDRNGVTTYNTYDGLNRIIRKYNSKDGQDAETTCVYDLNGGLKSSANSSSSAESTYDGFGRITEIKFGSGVKKSYTYDAGDRVTDYAIKIGSVEEYRVKYEYDAGGRRTAVVYSGLRSTFAYDAANRLVSETNGLTGAVTTYKYTLAGAAKTIDTVLADELVNHCEYKYDLVGNETEKAENGETTTYTYDALSRLVTAALPDGTTQNYEYDDYGNISSLTEIKGNNIAESLYYYDKAGRLKLKSCEKDGTQSRFEYDDCGNLIYREDVTTRNGGSAGSENRYVYIGYNLLAMSVTSYGETYLYTYDVEGLRNGKDSAEETTRYICESGNVV